MAELKINMYDDEIKEYIFSNYTYNRDGTLTRRSGHRKIGSLNEDGYIVIKIKNKKITMHKIVWLLNYGEFPTQELDHINRIRTDNRIENLRLSNRKEQHINAIHKPNPETGVCGVYIDKCTDGLKKKYTTTLNKKTYRFYTLEDAIKFREKNNLWV